MALAWILEQKLRIRIYSLLRGGVMRNCRLAVLLLVIAALNMDAAVVSTFADLPSFSAALGGAATVTEDFESFAAGTNLMGAQVLPGLTATTAMPLLEVFQNALGNTMFALKGGDLFRTNPAYILTGGGYRALGFDIAAWDPLAPGTLDIEVDFADGDSMLVNLVRPGGAVEADPQFFGIISSSAITSLRLSEPDEVGGGCCEEVALDNLIAANLVPEPGTFSLLAAAGVSVLLLRRRAR
jgi:hypothetical protein